MKKLLSIVALLLFSAISVHATTHNASSCSQADFAAALNGLVDGDTLNGPAGGGQATWTSSITSNVTLALVNGNNCTVVVSGSDIFHFTWTNSSFIPRITNFIMDGSFGLGGIMIDGNVPAFRIDHIQVNQSGVNHWLVTGYNSWGAYSTGLYGLVDHISWSGTGSTPAILINGINQTWLTATTMGTAAAVYIEDSSFTCPTCAGPGGSVTDAQMGARFVVRHNNVLNESIQEHDLGAGETRSARYMEVYNNVVLCQGSTTGACFDAIALRGGTGMIFNNSVAIDGTGNNGWQTLGFTEIFRLSYPGGGQSPWLFAIANPNIICAPNGGTSCGGTSTGGICSDFVLHYANPPHNLCYSVTDLSNGGCIANPTFAQGAAGMCGNAYYVNNTGPANTLLTQFDGTGTGGYPARDQTGVGPDTGANHIQTGGADPEYVWNNTNYIGGATIYNAVANNDSPYIAFDRDIYQQGSSFSGTSGVGVGLLSARPATCSVRVGYWATDTSTLYTCDTTNNWTAHYTPYIYPHPLQGGGGNASVISWGTTHQMIDGFGASTGYVERNPNLTSAQADCFFSVSDASCATGHSIGLEWVRIQDDETPGSAPDLPTLLLAQARGAKVFLSFNGPQITSGNYASQASYMVAKIQYFQTNGLTISAMGPLNEPSNTGTTAAALDTFVASYLYPAMVTAGISSIQIVLGESADWFVTDYVTACINDSSCGPHVPVVAGHAYYYGAGSQGTDGFAGGWNCCVDYAANPVPSSASSKRIWQTEVTGSATGPCTTDAYEGIYDGSMTNALVFAHNIHDFLAGVGGSSWQFWNLAAETSHVLPDCNDGLTASTYAPAKRFYAVGNWSKYVRYGWSRIDATANPQSGIYVTAFKDSTGVNFAIVAINTSGSSVSQFFSTSSFPTISGGVVTPYVTSSSLNLAAQSNVSTTGGLWSVSLPAYSVTTFVGSTTGTPVPVISWNVPSYDYGNVYLGSSASNIFSLTNIGAATLNVNLSLTGSDKFSQISTTCGPTLAASAGCDVIIKFTPTTVSTVTGTLTETDSVNSILGSVSILGSGAGGVANSPKNIL